MSDLVQRLRIHGRADDLNGLAIDTKRLRFSEREAIEAAQDVCMKAADRIEQLERENAELLAILQRWKNEWVTGGKLTLSGFTCLVHEAIAKHGGKTT